MILAEADVGAETAAMSLSGSQPVVVGYPSVIFDSLNVLDNKTQFGV